MFGFVRYRSRPEAARAIQNMNNSLLFGNKIRVSMARFKPRYSFWRKVKLGGHNDTMPGEEKEIKKKRDTEKIETSLTDSKEEDRKNEYSLKKPGKIKRVIGVVHSENLWKVKRCLVGTMNIVCSVRSIELRLQEWGLAEINVKRLDGKSYLLAFVNDELYMMLEDVNWSYLKEIFLEIKPWSEKARYVERATWVAEQWGEFEALGENANMKLDCERVSVLIATSYQKKIEKTVEIEVGDEVYMVRASELGFKDVSQIKIQATEKEEGRPDRQTKDSSSEASSADRTMEVNSQKEDALNAAIFGNLKINDYNYDLVETNNHLGESEMKGMEDRINQLETQEHVSTVNERKGEAVVSKIVEKVNGQVEVPAKDLVSKKKERKIGSLSKIQDRFLSEVEKRKRDRVKKRLKKEEIEETISELEGRSITYSDIEARREILLKEAQNTLAVGKTVGIDFIGDEQEP
ncbi:hypothetical protein V6N13_008892 [Hibiscus sabdariffa]